MYCLFNLNMTTYYYKFEIWESGELDTKSNTLYEDFDDVCDAVEQIMHQRVENFVKPEREHIKKRLGSTDQELYYQLKDEVRATYGTEIYIKRMTVVPKKQTYEELDCSEQDAHLETHFDEIFKRSKKVKTLNGRLVRNTWYDPTTRWVYQVYFSEGEKPHTFYDPESNHIRTIEFPHKVAVEH